jgi:hypothetical protein
MITALSAALRFGKWAAVSLWALSAIAPLIYSSAGQAWEICLRVEQLPDVSETERTMVTEALAGQYGESESINIRRIRKSYKQENSHYIAWVNSKLCAQSRCEYQVLQQRGDAVIDLFVFQGTGRVWFEPRQQGFYWQEHKDSYEFYGFEGADQARIGIAFPRTTNKIFIQAQHYDAAKLPACRN